MLNQSEFESIRQKIKDYYQNDPKFSWSGSYSSFTPKYGVESMMCDLKQDGEVRIVSSVPGEYHLGNEGACNVPQLEQEIHKWILDVKSRISSESK